MSGNGAIRGRVTSLAGEALGKAVVTAVDHRHGVEYAAVTGADGRFELEGVEPGQFQVQVRRTGYVPAAYGRGDGFGGGTPLTIEPGREIGEIKFELVPQAVVTGRITDEDGDPLENVTVTLLQHMEPYGLMPRNSQAQTNDEGEFRLSGVAPGKCFLCATYHGMGHHGRGRRVQAGLEKTYPPHYYPGTLDDGEAQPIEVAMGARLSGLEIRLYPTRSYHVRGRVEMPPDADPRTVTVNLHPRMRGSFFSMGGAHWLHGGSEFDLADVLPGSYVLTAACNEACVSRQAMVEIEVTDHDVDGVVLPFPEGSTVVGTVRGRGEFTGMHVNLNRAGDNAPGANGAVDRSGSFTLHHVTPGRYRLNIWEIPHEGYVKRVRYGGLEGDESSIEIGDETGAMLEVELAYDGGTVTGVVENAAGDRQAGSMVWVWTGDADPSRCVVADQDGRFELKGLPPGEYRAAASESRQAGLGPGPREEMRRRATVLAIGPEDRRTATLRL